MNTEQKILIASLTLLIIMIVKDRIRYYKLRKKQLENKNATIRKK